MADSHHAPEDPNAAPLRQQIVEDFSAIHYVVALVLGLGAIVLGTLFGLLAIND